MEKKYLALGDSYTIGEQVEKDQNFPFQTKYVLEHLYGIDIANPEIIAKTGWTTHELIEAIKEKKPSHDFSVVSLLIGVNNQYRKEDIHLYEQEFKYLLDLAISFAKGRDKLLIKYEINAYNKINENLTLSAGCNYLNITSSTRLHGTDLQYLTPDLLHYSKLEYQEWAQKLCKMIAESNILN